MYTKSSQIIVVSILVAYIAGVLAGRFSPLVPLWLLIGGTLGVYVVSLAIFFALYNCIARREES